MGFKSTPVQRFQFGDNELSSIDVEIQKLISKGYSSKIAIRIQYFLQANKIWGLERSLTSKDDIGTSQRDTSKWNMSLLFCL